MKYLLKNFVLFFLNSCLIQFHIQIATGVLIVTKYLLIFITATITKNLYELNVTSIFNKNSINNGLNPEKTVYKI